MAGYQRDGSAGLDEKRIEEIVARELDRLGGGVTAAPVRGGAPEPAKAKSSVPRGTNGVYHAPTTVIPAGSTTIYSEATTAAGFNPFPNWGQATQSAK